MFRRDGQEFNPQIANKSFSRGTPPGVFGVSRLLIKNRSSDLVTTQV